jgi:hypothetical protein
VYAQENESVGHSAAPEPKKLNAKAITIMVTAFCESFLK